MRGENLFKICQGQFEVKLMRGNSMIFINLDNGKKSVTDVCDGDCVGIAILDEVETGYRNRSTIVITTEDPENLDVIIAACERAKKRMNP